MSYVIKLSAKEIERRLEAVAEISKKLDNTVVDQEFDVASANAQSGKAVAAAIDDAIGNLELDKYATKEYVDNEINNAKLNSGDGDKVDLSNYATKDDIKNFISEVPTEYITEQELEAKKYLTEHQSLAGYATEDFVAEKIAEAELGSEEVDLSGYAKKDDIKDFVTESELDNKGYLTEHQSLADYAKKSEIPDVSSFITVIPEEYVTESELNTKGYLTEHQDLSEYAKKSDIPESQDLSEYAKKTDIPTVPTNVSQLTNDSNYITAIPTEYVTDSELTAKGYLTQHQSLDAYATRTYVDTDTITIPKFEDIDNSGFASKWIDCIKSWQRAINARKIAYMTFDNDHKNTSVNPLTYAIWDNTNKKFTDTYRDIFGEIKEGATGNLSCVQFAAMIAMGVPYEASRLCGYENVVGASGYGFDICKLHDATIDGTAGATELLVTYDKNNKLDITTFKDIVAQYWFYPSYADLGLCKTVKTNATATTGDIWVDAMKPGDIFCYGDSGSEPKNATHTMFCTGVSTTSGNTTITYYDIWPDYDIKEKKYVISSTGKVDTTNTTSASDGGIPSKKCITGVVRPFYQLYESSRDISKKSVEDCVTASTCSTITSHRIPPTNEADLNNYLTIGTYYSDSTRTNNTAIANCPTNELFKLTVENLCSSAATLDLAQNKRMYFLQTIKTRHGTEYVRSMYTTKNTDGIFELIYEDWKTKAFVDG